MEGKASQLKNVGLTPGILSLFLRTMFWVEAYFPLILVSMRKNLPLNSFQARISILSRKWLMKRCVCVCVRVLSQVWHVWLFALYGPQFARLLCPRDFPGKNTGAGCHFLLQRIFMTQASNSHFLWLLHWRENSLPQSHLGSPRRRGRLTLTSKFGKD